MPEAPPPPPNRDVSTWTRSEKVRRLLWSIVEATAFRCSFHTMYRFRASLLRAFGAKLGRGVRLRRTVHIEIPWHLDLGDGVSIGDRATLYALGPIRIGDRSFISQNAHLCAGTHDYRSPSYPLIRSPITIGSDCWIAADAFIGPGITVGNGALVAARAVVVKDVREWMIVAGNPATERKEREFEGKSAAT